MPFAAKFWAAMEIPFPGDEIGGFGVEYVDVQHHGIGDGRYEYPVTMILTGRGGKQGVRSALRELLGSRKTTFSGYGNPYHCRFGKPAVESLGELRYEVKVTGIGVRFFLREELTRFAAHLKSQGRLTIDGSALEHTLDAYMEAYIQETSRRAAACRRRIQRAGARR